MSNERMQHIRENLGTQATWTKGDYQDFYNRDVVFLLDRIATLERERDEARAAYCKLLDVAVRGGRGATDEIRERFQDHPEWRKGEAH